MELISMKCPQCMGTVEPFGDGSRGKCEYCGSVFALSGAQDASQRAEEADADADLEVEDVDIEQFFDDFASTLDENEDYEFFIGTDFESGKGPSKLDGARKYFGVEDDEDIYLVLDTTMFGSCKVGFACAESGIYMKDEDGDQCFLSWEDLPESELEVEGNRLTIQGSPFITMPTEADMLFELLCDLQNQL